MDWEHSDQPCGISAFDAIGLDLPYILFIISMKLLDEVVRSEVKCHEDSDATQIFSLFHLIQVDNGLDEH